jgi:hypothetical protein
MQGGADHMNIIEILLAHTHGGTDAAVVPLRNGIPSNLPAGNAPAAVPEVLNLLFTALTSSSSSRHWVFLVGGPGNGKSHQLAAFMTRLIQGGGAPVQNSDRSIGRYCDDIRLNNQTLRIINDATIRPPTEGTGSLSGHLATDLRSVVRDATHLLCNVNRGVLIEEHALSHTAASSSFETILLSWLVSNKLPTEQTVLAPSPSTSTFYHAATLKQSSSSDPIRIHVVSLDTLSLLELIPSKNGLSVSNIDAQNPVCVKYTVMELENQERWQTPAGHLLQSILANNKFEQQGCTSCAASELCPFLSNIHSLRGGPAGLGFLVMLRAAEISIGRLFNYRDLWSLITTAILGPSRTEWTTTTPCEWVLPLAAQATSRDTHARRKAVVELSLQRLHHALFPGRLPNQYFCGLQTWRLADPLAVPALSNLRLIDPASDVTGEWAEDVHSSMEEWAFQQSPLRHLRDINPDIDAFASSLDQALEKELFESLAGPKVKDSQRRDHIRWLGTSYYRMLALNKRWPGHRNLINEWIRIRAYVDAGQEHIIDSELDLGLQHLLFPEFPQVNFDRACLLPLFASRIEPLRGPQERNTLSVAVPRQGQDAVLLSYATTGDALWLCLKRCARDGGGELARLRLDYYSCREALVSARGYGFTEAGATSMPRVERVRASLVAADRSHYSLVLVGNMAVSACPAPKEAN